MSRQIINLAGALAVLVILALGIALVALPTFSQAGAVDKQADETAQTNDIYQIQVDTLREQETRLTELERDLAELRAEIPATALNDEVFELIGAAAGETGAIVESIDTTDTEAWTTPGASDEATTATTATEPTPETAETPETTPDATDATTDSSADGATAGEEAATPTTELDPRRVVPFTIVVTLTDALQAARFIDALRADDRLLSIEHAALTEEGEELRLTVNARSLVLAEN